MRRTVLSTLVLLAAFAGAMETQVEVTGAEVSLSPKNTKIVFVGTHKADDPMPRTGHFEKFAGTAQVDGAALKSLSVDIDTPSLITDIDKLTNHLKSPDFFNVRRHPKASFRSSSIKDEGGGKVKVTGELTLLGTTKSVTFPATVSTEKGLTLDAEFTIDRTDFGMDFAVDKVEKSVSLKVSVGG